MLASYLFEEIIMEVKWSKLVLKIVVWLSAEIFLTALGLDNMADYSEFVFQSRALVQISETSTSLGFSG